MRKQQRLRRSKRHVFLIVHYLLSNTTRLNLYSRQYQIEGQTRTGFFYARDLDQSHTSFLRSGARISSTRKIRTWHAPYDSIEEILTEEAAEPTSTLAIRLPTPD